MQFITLEQAERATVTCFVAQVPVALWGPVGIGKSSVVRQIAERLDYKIYDYRLSDKEPSDLGGIPYPQDAEDGHKVLTYLMPQTLPFDTDEKAIVFLDEFDRARLDVQNTALQLILDRKLNGHELSKNAFVILAGNSTSDIGTTPLSKAAANRMCHLYIEIGSQDALRSFLAWAQKSGDVSPLLQGFAAFRQEVWANGAAKEKPDVTDMAYATPRSFEYADRILGVAEELSLEGKFETKDITKALMAGCIGEGAATEFLQYKKMFEEVPQIQEILDGPESVKIPKEPSLLYSLTLSLVNYAKGNEDAVNAILVYGMRWPEEPSTYLVRRLVEDIPRTLTAPQYHLWKTKNNRPSASRVSVDFGQKKVEQF